MELAIRYLGPRRRFEKEVVTHLKKKGVAEAELGETLERLRELSLVSDEDTTRAWIRDRMNFAPRGRALLRRELLSKGVPAEIVEDALAEELDEGAEAQAALDYLRRGRGKWAGLSEAVARRRMWSALGRRGFPSSVCREALIRFAEETGIPAGEEVWD
ncbi:RecX family transcriptional regulator [bacterium]|nr:RecX family transcriptional regulator [bacterium]